MTDRPEPLKIAIAGAGGRMGRAVAAAAQEHPRVRAVAGFDRSGAGWPGVMPREAALDAAEVVVDFTSAAASAELAQVCADRGGPAMVIGSTGFSEDQLQSVRAAATRIAMVLSGNFSLGVNLLMSLVRQAARTLEPQSYDIEIFEAHHRRKVDAPSGTALMLGEAAAQGRGIEPKAHEVRVRDGLIGPRPPGAIGFSVMRGGGIVGEHSVTFAADDEILTLSHSARERSLFARGALAAALWVHGRPPGLYSMQDVLGLQA